MIGTSIVLDSPNVANNIKGGANVIEVDECRSTVLLCIRMNEAVDGVNP